MDKRSETGHEINATYFCPYWREVYAVTQIHENGDVTVRWHGARSTAPRTTRHHTQRGGDPMLCSLEQVEAGTRRASWSAVPGDPHAARDFQQYRTQRPYLNHT